MTETSQPEFGDHDFKDLTASQQDAARRRHLIQIEWNSRTGPFGNVLYQLRDRARAFEGRAHVVLGALVLAVLVGLGYYVGLPLWGECAVGECAGYPGGLLEEQISFKDRDIETAEAEARALASRISERLTARGHWYLRDSGITAGLPAVAVAKDGTGVIRGERGIIVATVPSLTEDMRKAGGIDELKTALANIPAHAHAQSEDNALTALAANRSLLSKQKDEFQTDLSRLRENVDTCGYKERVRLMADTLATCAGETPQSEVIAACAAALKDAGAAADDWWRYLAEKIPGGILLLFLLATLSGLYRYNLRMAGFYHARADALELMDGSVPQEKFEALAQTLAAEKVEFKAGKTPADQITELTKAAIERTK